MTLLPLPRGTEPPSTCPTCANGGCGCPLDSPGCGHYGCWGYGPRDCPGVTAEETRYASRLEDKRAAEARILTRRAAHHALLRSAGIGIIGA